MTESQKVEQAWETPSLEEIPVITKQHVAAMETSDDPAIRVQAGMHHALLRTVGRNMTELYFETIKYGFVIPTILLMFAGIGLFSRPWAGPTRIWTLLTATFFVGSLSFLVTHVESRFLYSAVPFVLPFMAEGWRRAEVWALASLSGGGAARAAGQYCAMKSSWFGMRTAASFTCSRTRATSAASFAPSTASARRS